MSDDGWIGSKSVAAARPKNKKKKTTTATFGNECFGTNN